VGTGFYETTNIIRDEIDGIPVTSIAPKAYKTRFITNVTLGANVTTIGDSAFEGSKLASITGLEHVVSIGNKAFYNIPTLTTPIVLNSVQSIGDNAFGGTTNLASLILDLD